MDKPVDYILFYNDTINSTPTNLISLDGLYNAISNEELLIFKKSIFLLKTPQFQKFVHLISGLNNDIRYDPNIMSPYNSYSKLSQSILTKYLEQEEPIKIEWKQHKIVIIDNRRVLHNRDKVQDNNRILTRIYINELEKK